MTSENTYIPVQEAFQILHNQGLVSDVQTVRRWLREGKIVGHLRYKSEGYSVDVESLKTFIEEKRLKQLKRQLVFRQGYERGFNDAKKMLEDIKQIKEG